VPGAVVTKLDGPGHNPQTYIKLVLKLVLLSLALPCCARAQLVNQEQELEVRNLPTLLARSHDPTDVLFTSLDTILHDHEVCCGKDSALVESLEAADPKSLKDVADRIQGRHLLSDGRPIMVTVNYLSPTEANSGVLTTQILNQHPAIMEWNSHLYVVHGVAYFWVSDGQGGAYTQLLKLFLTDTRYSDSRREVTLTREADDFDKVQGLLYVDFKLM
jgi:hypothetical protein